MDAANAAIHHVLARPNGRRIGRSLLRAPRASFRKMAKKKGPHKAGPLLNNPGSVLLSHTASRAVPSAPKSLTSEFGMGSGVASSMSPPEILGRLTPVRPVLAIAGRFVLRAVTRGSQPESWVEHAELAPDAFDVCLRDMIKPHDLLVPVSSVNYFTSTPGLSTS